MAAKVLNYIPKKSFIHSLSGTTKLVIFLSFSFLCGLSFDTRVLLFLLLMLIVVIMCTFPFLFLIFHFL